MPDSSTMDAFIAANNRGLLPTHLDSAGLRNLDAAVRARSVFIARGTSVVFAGEIKRVIDGISSGTLSESDARQELRGILKDIGYTPEGGFPDAPAGSVPPADAGTIRDISSNGRLNLIIGTQVEMMQGAGNQARQNTPDRIEAAPALELIRHLPRVKKRVWLARWKLAGGKLYATAPGRMIAFKGDPVWGELGSSENFKDALDTDYPPFAFNSGMGVDEIVREEVIALGIRGPEGETIDEWFNGPERPRVISGELPLPTPSISLKDVDPALVDEFRKQTGATEGKSGRFDFSDLLAKELAARDASVAARTGGGQ